MLVDCCCYGIQVSAVEPKNTMLRRDGFGPAVEVDIDDGKQDQTDEFAHPNFVKIPAREFRNISASIEDSDDDSEEENSAPITIKCATKDGNLVAPEKRKSTLALLSSNPQMKISKKVKMVTSFPYFEYFR